MCSLSTPDGWCIDWSMRSHDNTVSQRPRGPFQKGHDPRRGVGKKGRSGRKSNKFKTLCREITASPRFARRIRMIMREGSDKDLLAMAKFLAEYVHQKPSQKLDVNSTSLEDLVAGIHPKDGASK